MKRGGQELKREKGKVDESGRQKAGCEEMNRKQRRKETLKKMSQTVKEEKTSRRSG